MGVIRIARTSRYNRIMAGGRPGPALFELIKDRTGTSGAAQQQARSVPVIARPKIEGAPVPEPAPLPPVPPSGPPPPAEAPEKPRAWVTERESPGLDLARPITVSTFTAWLAVAGVLISWVIVWTAAYKLGYANADARANREFTAGSGVRDPLNNDDPIPVNPNLVSSSASSSAKAPAPVTPHQGKAAGSSQSTQTPTPRQTAPPTGGGAPAGDPRIPGYNYYMLASLLDQESAERIVAFLAQNGVPAIAVAKGGGRANNRSQFTVYAAEGITAEQYRARSPERTRLEAEIRRLGQIWKRDHKGGTGFATATWEKYKP